MSDFKTFRETTDAGFEAYCYKIYPELSKAYKAVIAKVNDTPSEIENQLELLSTHLPRINDILSMADMFLNIEAYKKYTNEGENALHRKLRNDYEVAEVRAVRDKVKGLVKSVEVRIMVLQSRLKSSNQEHGYGHFKHDKGE